jgi:4-aminobutyrate aminotransferase-like enzyme
MGPLAKKVLRIAPPITITEAEARDSVACLAACFAEVERQPAAAPAASFTK